MRPGLFILGLALLTAGFMPQDQKASWTFDTDKSGAMAPGFTSAVGKWEVTADGTAPSRPNALAQLAKSSGSSFNLTLISATKYQDIDLSVKMKAIAGNVDQGGGLVWRARDAGNYYIVRYNPLEDNYRVYTVVNGRRSQLQNADIPHTDGWHTLRTTMTGDHIECYYDGKKYLDVRDTTFKDAGKIGLWTKADAQSHFDDITVIGK
jgi:hypothetical protein